MKLSHRIKYWLRRTAHSPWYVPIAGLLCCLAAMSMTVPATAVLVPAVILATPKWRRLVLACAVGSSVAAGIIAGVFQAWDWQKVYAHYPEFAQSEAWLQVLDWMRHYGLWALTAISALPLPQTPALIFCGITQINLPGIVVAIFVGKLIKYGVVAWTVARFPERFLRYLRD